SSAATVTLLPAETPLQPSVANARAEADPTVGRPGGAAPEPAPFAGAAGISDASASAADESRSTIASRWPDQAKEIPTTSEAAPVASDAMPNSAPSATAPPIAADMHSTSPSAGFPPLLLV